MIKRKDIAADAPKTFADVIVKLESLDGLTKTRRRDLISAMNAMARFLDKPVDQLEANLNILRQRLRQFHPKQARVSEKTYANVKSAVLAALQLTGTNNKRAAGSSPMSEEFQILYDAVPDQLVGYKLSRLFRYCSEEGLRPDQVSDATVEAFEAHVIDQTLNKDPGKVAREAVLTWNRLKDKVEGWPDVTLRRAPARIPWTFPLEQFPQSFQQDVDAWFDRMAMTDLFDDDAPVGAVRHGGHLVFDDADALQEIVGIAIFHRPSVIGDAQGAGGESRAQRIEFGLTPDHVLPQPVTLSPGEPARLAPRR